MKANINTNKQINNELDSMYNRMRDPKEHEKKALQNKNKKNVEQRTRKYGL